MEGEGLKKNRTVTIHKSEVSTENTKKAIDLVQEAMDKFQIEKVRPSVLSICIFLLFYFF